MNRKNALPLLVLLVGLLWIFTFSLISWIRATYMREFTLIGLLIVLASGYLYYQQLSKHSKIK